MAIHISRDSGMKIRENSRDYSFLEHFRMETLHITCIYHGCLCWLRQKPRALVTMPMDTQSLQKRTRRTRPVTAIQLQLPLIASGFINRVRKMVYSTIRYATIHQLWMGRSETVLRRSLSISTTIFGQHSQGHHTKLL